MKPMTYAGFIMSIKDDSKKICAEKKRLDDEIEALTSDIKSAVSESNVFSLLVNINIMEVLKISRDVGGLGESVVSDEAGYYRHIRAIAASQQFDRQANSEDCNETVLNKILQLCEGLWDGCSSREMIETLSAGDQHRHGKFMNAKTMSLLGAFQRELFYVEQAEERTVRLYGAFSENIIEPQVGCSVHKVCEVFKGIRETVEHRLNQLFDAMSVLKEWHSKYAEFCDSGATQEEIDRFRHDKCGPVITETMEKSNKLSEGIFLFGMSFFEEYLGGNAAKFIDFFSFVPSEVNLEYASPYDGDEVRSRPFAKLSCGQYFLMDYYYSSYSSLYRLLHLFSTDKLLQKVNLQRDRSLEKDFFNLFGTMLEREESYANFYIPTGTKGDFSEHDALFVRGKIAIAAECKARPLRDVSSHRGCLVKIEDDVKRTIQHGYDQACSTIRYLKLASSDIRIWDSNKPKSQKVIASFARGQVQDAYPIIILDSYYGMIASNLAPWIQIDKEIGYPWVIDRDTFESIFRVLNTFDQFVKFLRWRRDLHGLFVNEDEAVFAGFFLRHGPQMPPEDQYGLVQLDPSYADVFEIEYYKSKGLDLDVNLPGQDQPAVWLSQSMNGDNVDYAVKDNVFESINLYTGESNIEKPWDSHINSDIMRKEVFRSDESQVSKRVGRNSPCPCGSRRKYKMCCLKNTI